MTAKVDKKKIAFIFATILVLIIGLVAIFSGEDAEPTISTAVSVDGNNDRVSFLQDFGWEVTTSPKESSQVRIPQESSPVFDRYNALQKSQGYDLKPYAGETVMRYVYQVNNYPGASEPVYATLLIRKNQIIGGDVTDTGAKGKIQGFQRPKDNSESTPSAPASDPTESTESTSL
jgi:hypothetical protein